MGPQCEHPSSYTVIYCRTGDDMGALIEIPSDEEMGGGGVPVLASQGTIIAYSRHVCACFLLLLFLSRVLSIVHLGREGRPALPMWGGRLNTNGITTANNHDLAEHTHTHTCPWLTTWPCAVTAGAKGAFPTKAPAPQEDGNRRIWALVGS